MKTNLLLRIGVALMLVSMSAIAAQISERDAVRAIVGEAANQGADGMRAVASAIRNRGTLQGVYGLNAKHVDLQPAWVFEQARKAWHASATKDYANGADHWESVDFKRPAWSRNMRVVLVLKKHVFFKA